MRNIFTTILLSILFLTTTGAQYDLPKGATKKVEKTLESLWPDVDLVKNPLKLSPEQQKKLSFDFKENTFYAISKNGKIEAYMMITQAKSKISMFDYMVVFKPDLTILKVKVLIYREEYGGEIGSKRWLRQFIGKKDPEKVKFGSDVQSISGATISARSLTYDVQKSMRQIIELKTKGII